MKHCIFVLLIGLAMNNGQAQDAYHTQLQSNLQAQYSLPSGNWSIPNTESATLSGDYAYGGIASDQTSEGQDFTQKVNIVINSAGDNQWDAGYGIQNTQTITNGSAGLMVIWLRSIGAEGQVSLFAENTTTYFKEFQFNLALTEQWEQYIVPFDAEQTYDPGELAFGLHLAWQAQTIEIGGLAVLNYGTAVNVDDLPLDVNSDEYGGWEADASWREGAASRIESIRKADLNIRVEDTEGNPIPDVNVSVKMLRHEYGFGSALVSRLFADNNSHNTTYADKITNLDGEGHGFNCVVFENALKWPSWEQNWITTPDETAHAAQWLVDRDIKIRGHNLVWPGWSNLPNDMEANQNNIPYLQERINDHIEEILTYPGIAGNIAEWDVINENTTNRDLEYAFQGNAGYPTGRELYVDIFNQVAAIDPNTKMYINDYVTIGQANTGGGNYDLKMQFAQELIDAGVTLDGIGFQSHIGGIPTSIYDVYDILEDFYTTLGTTAKITEYDTNEAMSDELAATYLRDFLTITFSHESTNGFLMWGFWDGAHYQGNAPLFYEDWSLKPAGQTFIDMVFDEWWTEENGTTNTNGAFDVRGFKGSYEVTIDCGDVVLVDTVQLLDNIQLIKIGEGLVANNKGVDFVSLTIFPNPANKILNIEAPFNGAVPIQLYSPTGQLVYTDQMLNGIHQIPLHFGKGVFELVLETPKGRRSHKIIVQ